MVKCRSASVTKIMLIKTQLLSLMCCSAEDEKESSSSEDDDDDRRRLNDDLLGKVVCIESGSDCNSWFFALVSPGFICFIG